MLGAPKPITAPIMARKTCALALGFPMKNENAANTRPKIAHRGKMVEINFVWIAASVDSTLAMASSGISRATVKATGIARYALLLFNLNSFVLSTNLKRSAYAGKRHI